MRIAVGVITRRRPRPVSRLLASFVAMQRPEGCQVTFIVVENDKAPSLAREVETFRAQVAEPVVYEVEPSTGIPFARNRVLDLARAKGAEFLTFVDDDEVVSPDWLPEMVRAASDRALILAGAPVHPLADPSERLTAWNRAVLSFFQTRSARRARTRAEAVAADRDHLLNVYTNNWIVNLNASDRLGARFDEALRFSGGSDTKFSMDVRRAGGRSGWVTSAPVYEIVPTSRLSLTYVFRRARDQAINAAVFGRKPVGSGLVFAALRTLEAVVLAMTAPIAGRRPIVRAAFKMGQATGRVSGVTGGRSLHYLSGQ